MLDKYKFPQVMPDVAPHDHGFFEPDNASAFNAVCGPHVRLYLELGCWIGKSMRYVLSRCPSAIGIGIDTWYVPSHHLNPPFLPVLYETFVRNLWDYRERVRAVRALTGDGIRLVEPFGQMVNLVYIDAGHDYNSVLTDVRNVTRICPNATIVLDDNEPIHGQGVVDVVANWSSIVDRPYVCDDPTSRVPIFYPEPT